MSFVDRPCNVAPRLVLPLLILLFIMPMVPAAESDKGNGDAKIAEAGEVEVHFADNSVLKLKLLDSRLTLNTPYGKLEIPIAEVRRIEFATRLADDVTKQIDGAIIDLGSTEFSKREAATAALRKHREKAYPALLGAAKVKDPEVVRRAEALLEELREAVPEERLVFRKYDVVETSHSKISGSIEASSFKVHTAQFGDLPMRLADVRSLKWLGIEPEIDVASALPDPGNLGGYQNQMGKIFTFRVIGAMNNNIWGTDVYTTDSALASAAVHAGVVQVGKPGIVRVKIVPSPPAFQGSTRHGITSNGYNMFIAAYQILK